MLSIFSCSCWPFACLPLWKKHLSCYNFNYICAVIKLQVGCVHFYSLFFPQNLAPCPALSSHSINICHKNKWRMSDYSDVPSGHALFEGMGSLTGQSALVWCLNMAGVQFWGIHCSPPLLFQLALTFPWSHYYILSLWLVFVSEINTGLRSLQSE